MSRIIDTLILWAGTNRHLARYIRSDLYWRTFWRRHEPADYFAKFAAPQKGPESYD